MTETLDRDRAINIAVDILRRTSPFEEDSLDSLRYTLALNEIKRDKDTKTITKYLNQLIALCNECKKAMRETKDKEL